MNDEIKAEVARLVGEDRRFDALKLLIDTYEIGDWQAEEEMRDVLLDMDINEEHVSYLESMAEQNSAVALYWLGALYDEGVATLPCDEAKAFEYISRAADLGVIIAMNDMGDIYYDGYGSVEADRKKYAEYNKRAYDAGYTRSSFSLYNYYVDESSEEYNPALAVKYLEAMVADGDAVSCRFLGTHYLSGDGVDVDHAKAAELFATASSWGDIESTIYLAKMYDKGVGVREDSAKALDILKSLAGKSRGMGEYALYKFYMDAKHQDDGLAIDYLRAAADVQLERAKYEYGVCCVSGDNGIEINYALAAHYLRDISSIEFTHAYDILSYIYEVGGYGIVADKELAEYYRDKAQGN